jgi:hypothetical protein
MIFNSLLNPLRNNHIYFRQRENAFGYHNSLEWGFCAGQSLELGLEVHDQNQTCGHLKGQDLLFRCIRGYLISDNP